MKKKLLVVAVASVVAALTTYGVVHIVKAVKKAKKERELYGDDFDDSESRCCGNCSCHIEDEDSYDDSFLDDDDIFEPSEFSTNTNEDYEDDEDAANGI